MVAREIEERYKCYEALEDFQKIFLGMKQKKKKKLKGKGAKS